MVHTFPKARSRKFHFAGVIRQLHQTHEDCNSGTWQAFHGLLESRCPEIRCVSHLTRASRREAEPMGEETRGAVRAVETLERKDRVLIVEDEDNARKGYEQLLQRWGCDVLGVGTAEEA